MVEDILEVRLFRERTIGDGGMGGSVVGEGPSNSSSARVGREIAEADANGFRENSWSRPIGDGPDLCRG